MIKITRMTETSSKYRGFNEFVISQNTPYTTLQIHLSPLSVKFAYVV